MRTHEACCNASFLNTLPPIRKSLRGLSIRKAQPTDAVGIAPVHVQSWRATHAIYLLKEHHGTGTGRTLFETVRRELAVRDIASMYLWVLDANPTRRFYERQGGLQFAETQIEIGGAPLREIAYRFD